MSDLAGGGVIDERVIKTGARAMIGTKYTSRPYTKLAGLRKALLPYKHLGDWQVLREIGYSRTGRARPQFVGVVFNQSKEGRSA